MLQNDVKYKKTYWPWCFSLLYLYPSKRGILSTKKRKENCTLWLQIEDCGVSCHVCAIYTSNWRVRRSQYAKNKHNNMGLCRFMWLCVRVCAQFVLYIIRLVFLRHSSHAKPFHFNRTFIFWKLVFCASSISVFFTIFLLYLIHLVFLEHSFAKSCYLY